MGVLALKVSVLETLWALPDPLIERLARYLAP